MTRRRQTMLFALAVGAAIPAVALAGSPKNEASVGVDAKDAQTFGPIAEEALNRQIRQLREEQATRIFSELGVDLDLVQQKIDKIGFDVVVEFGQEVLRFAGEAGSAFTRFALSNDPFITFDTTISNTSSRDIIFSLRGLQPLIPLTDATFARNYLEVNLNDADANGFASLRQSFGLGNRLQEGLALEDGTGQLRFLGNQLIGDDIVFENGVTQLIGDGGQILDTVFGDDPASFLFDTGVVDGPTASGAAPLVTLFLTTEFVLSAGDSVTLRGGVLLADDLGLMPDPVLINAFLGALAIPTPGSGALFLLASPFAVRRRR